MDKRYLIFISSTYEDLVEERKKVIQTVLEHDCFPASMEFFSAVGMPPLDLIKKVMKECDYYILIIGDNYGSDCENGKSFIEKEYDIAIDEGIPVLAFLKNSDSSKDESDKEEKELVEFRERVKGEQTIVEWSNSDDLARKVSSSISTAIKNQKRRGWVRGPQDLEIKTTEVKETNNSFVIKIDDVEFKMVYVQGASFQMGATLEQVKYAEKYKDVSLEKEMPVHSVTVEDYWIGETQVTQALWVKIMGYNPSYFSQSRGNDDLDCPVEQVTWNECKEFIEKLKKVLNNKLKDGMVFDFPTEEQWEFAARGGKNSKNYIYAGANKLGEVAWYDGIPGTTRPVKRLEPNELGLYDMSGNVWEWCKTTYEKYGEESEENTKAKRVGRGGCWHSKENCCRVSYRNSANMTHAGNGLGLRLVLNKIKE